MNSTRKTLTSLISTLTTSEKERRLAIALAFSGVLLPGLHKFYLRQWGWGLFYLVLLPTHIPQVASLVEGLWYGSLDKDEFDHNFNPEGGDFLEQATPTSFGQGTSGKGDSSLAQRQSLTDSMVQSDLSYFVDRRKNAGAALNRDEGDSFWVTASNHANPQETQQSLAPSGLIDVNRATLEDWLRLPGLTADQGRSLVTLQAQGVQFHCLEDLAAALSLPVERLQPLASALAFYYYDPKGFNADDVTPIQNINPNQASIALLLRIPGVDAALALQILHHRTRPYLNLADLQQRLSLTAKQVEHLMHYLEF
ncbi:MAG: helix-hairpin-helix domain-containing protein [Elainellaceae cyanobacterium]